MDETIPITRSAPQAPKVIPMSDTPVKQSFPTEFIDLPSEGHFYPESSPLSSGRIELKFMTAREEDILTSQNLIKKGIVLDELIKALVVTPGVDINDLLLGDKNAIFIAARRLAYGDKYPVTVKCPKCDFENKIDINLSQLKNREFDFSAFPRGVNRFSFTLPYSKKNIEYKLLTNKDESQIEAELKGLAKLAGPKSGAAPEITTRLKYMIVSIDGDENRSNIKSFVDSMLSRDSIEFRQYVRKNNPDIDLAFDFVCADCGHTERMAVPMGVDFFWPDART